MMNFNENKYNHDICKYEHFSQRASESTRRETLRRRNHRCRIELLDIIGRKVKVVDMPGGVQKTTVEISELTAGVYTYKFFVGNNLQKTGKLLKN
jgi:hypothetical protein